MSEALSAIKDWWAIIMGVCGVLIWLVRLESRAIRNSADNESRKQELIALELRLEKQRKEDMELRREDREDTKRILQEVQRDIKLLLQQAVK